MSKSENAPTQKPRLRGALHLWSAPIALLCGVGLVLSARTPKATFAACVFAASLTILFSVSGAYHRIDWQPNARLWMRRLDHASIFLLIAGTYTPVAMLGLPEREGTHLLTWVWIGAGVGMLRALFWPHAPKPVSAGIAILVGWTLLPYWNEVRRALSPVVLVLLGVGGLFYTVGALAYATKRPNPVPNVFGYHEVFHACTLVAAALHFASVWLLVRL